MGRPSDFTTELAAKICERLQDGRTLRDVCRDDDMPDERTVRGWAAEDREGFYPQYARAREIGYQSMADELLEIADDGKNDWMERRDQDGNSAYVLNGEHVQRSRLRSDTRKWLLSKALPKIYGDKLQHTGADGVGPIQHQVERIERVIVDSSANSDSTGVPSATGSSEV